MTYYLCAYSASGKTIGFVRLDPDENGFIALYLFRTDDWSYHGSITAAVSALFEHREFSGTGAVLPFSWDAQPAVIEAYALSGEQESGPKITRIT